jgi:hypothetical protein
VTGVLALVLATAGVGLGGALGARLLGLTDPLDRLLAAFVLACAEVLLVSLAAGAVLERFHPWVLVLGTAAWDAVLIAALRRRRDASHGARILPATASVLRTLAPWQLIVVTAAVLATLWRVVLAALLPPYAYDALTYHLTAVAAWAQSGKIGPDPYSFCCGRYPSNAEVLFAWPTVLLGRDTLTDEVQVVTALLGMLAVAGLARAAGVSAPGSVTAAALFGLTPIVLAQANTDYNDVTVAAFFLASLYFGTRFLAGRGFAFAQGSEHPRLAFALLAGVAAGLVLGTKTSGIVLAGVVALPVLTQLAIAARRGRLPSGAFAVVAAALFAGALLLTGGWWYARNWVATGNPLAPFEVRALGVEVFHGTASLHDYLTIPPGGARNPVSEIGRSWYDDLVFWTRSGYSYEERRGGLGPLWSWLGWPLLTFAGLAAVRRRPDLVVSVLLPAAVAFAVLPYRWWARFTIYLAALGAVAVLATLEHLRRDAPRRALAAAVVVLSLAGGALATARVDPAGFGDRLTVPGTLSLMVHPSRPRSVGDLFFHEYAWLDDVPSHATIGVDSRAPQIRFLYPLFGAKLERQVVLLADPRESLVDRRLTGTGPVYLFVQSGDAFDRWARARPRRFRPIFAKRGTSVFLRVQRG